MAYWGSDEMIHVTTYDMNGTLTPQPVVSADPVFMKGRGSGILERSARFDIIAGDLDGDDTDEIVLAWVEEATCGSPGDCWQLKVRVYEVGSGGAPVAARGEVVLFSKLSSGSDYLDRVGMATGGFDDVYGDEIAVVYRVGNNNGTDYEYLQPLVPSATLYTLTADLSRRSTLRTGQNLTGDPVTVDAADMNADGKAEVNVLTGQLRILESNAALLFSTISTQSVSDERGSGGRRSMAVADLDADNAIANGDTVWRPEIVVVANLEVNAGINPDDEFLIEVFEYIPGQFNMRKRGGLRDAFTDYNGVRPFAVVAGDFDGSSVRVGTPSRYTKTDIIQPLIILNAPPSHFDVFEGSSFDVNGCYNEGVCDFVTTYSTVTQTSTNLQASFNRDWSIGTEASGGFKIPKIDVGVSVTLRGRYGEGFSKVAGSTTTFTVSQSIEARGDDFIYATVVDYDVWEYPLFVDNALEGYLAVVIPGLQSRAWFPSKSPTATEYVPAHEVGNILSYRDVAAPEENSALDEAVR